MTTYHGPRLWLDRRRGTWTIVDGRLRMRTGLAEHQAEDAERMIREYADGTYQSDRPRGPTPTFKVPPRKGIYVIGFGPYIKIGITVNLDARLSQLQTPEPVVVHGLLEGRARHERHIQNTFSEYRLQGEWFLKKGRLAEWIEGGCSAAILPLQESQS